MDKIEKLKETILRDFERLTLDDTFHFGCGPHVECFNRCCADVNIFLTPYDVLRMRKALKLSSGDFLSRYTIIPFDENQTLPVPLMLMNDSDEKKCHFVDSEKGCTIYNDRPWPCRMYPLGLAAEADDDSRKGGRFYFLMTEDHCLGFKYGKKWSVREWMDDQGVDSFDEFGELFKQVTVHPRLAGGWKPTPKHIEMYWMALYDLDKFRTFVNASSFLLRFELSPEEISKIETDDAELLKLGFKWIRMAFYGEKTLTINPEVIENLKQKSEAAKNNG